MRSQHCWWIACCVWTCGVPVFAQPNARVQQLVDDLRAGRGQAVAELVRQGPVAVPEVAKLLKEADPKVRGLAARTLGEMGEAAKGAAPDLAAALADEDAIVASQASQALSRCGPSAVPAIVEILKKDPPRQAVVRAAEALRVYGEAGKAAVPAFVAALRQSSDPSQLADLLPIVEALGKIGPAAAPAVEPLSQVLAKIPERETPGGEDVVARGLQVHIVVALGKIGPSAKGAAPALVTLLKGKTTTGDPLPQQILEALASIGTPLDELTPVLIEQLEAKQAPRLLLLRTLAQVGTPPRAHVKTLAEGMRDKNPWVRLYSAALVGKVEPDNLAVVSVFIESLREPDASLRRQAAMYIGQVRPRDEAVQDVLREATGDASEEVQRAAHEALARFKK